MDFAYQTEEENEEKTQNKGQWLKWNFIITLKIILFWSLLRNVDILRGYLIFDQILHSSFLYDCQNSVCYQ